MSRRRLVIVALTTAAVAWSPPLMGGTATAATDDGTRPALVLAADTDGDGGYGLWLTDNRGTHSVIAESDNYDVLEVASSRDGQRIAYLLDSYDAAGNAAHEYVVVRDTTFLGKPVVRAVDDLAAGQAQFDAAPALSPDGNAVVWSRVDASGSNLTVKTLRSDLTRSTSTPTVVATGLVDAAYLDATTLIGSTESGIVTVADTGGDTHPVAGLTSDDDAFTVSPDGTRLAWLRDTSPADSNASTAEVHVATLSLTAGTATLSADRVLASGVDATSPTWTRDGGYVKFVITDPKTNLGQVWQAPQDARSPAVTAQGLHDTIAIATAVTDAVSPGPATLLPATFAPTAVTIRWTPPADADVYAVHLTRSGGSLPDKSVTISAPASSYRDSGLLVGKTYTYTAYVIDSSGNTSSTTSRQVTTLQASAIIPDPTSTRYYLNPSFRVAFGTMPSYTVQYRTNGSGGLTTWLNHATGTSHVFSPARAGWSYGFLVTAYDAYGNSSAPTGVGIATVPYDQNRATFSGGYVTQSLVERYLGNATILQKVGAAARLVVNGNRLQVIGERCISCGVMDVYVDGVRVAGVDTHFTQRVSRAVLYTRALRPGVNHSIVVKARGTAGHPNVVLDGWGVRH